MNPMDLQQVRAGFDDEAHGSQAVFRAALDALSHPGRPRAVDASAEAPRHGHRAAALVLLALLDADCSLWLSPALRGSDAAAWLRFHTGCRLVDQASQAQFLWVGLGEAMPALDCLAQGTDSDPDHSATCVLEVQALDASGTPPGAGLDGAAWRLRGPGIDGEASLCAPGAPADFAHQWAANHAAFPRGVDLLLATPTHIAGLPRTTALQASTDTRRG